MRYNFDEVIDRSGTNSAKWDKKTLQEMFGVEDVLPFWVADMDFKAARPIVDAVVKQAEHGIYGYSSRPDSYYEAIINWTKRRHGWEIKREWIEFTPGVVPAINYAIQAFCMPGDKIMIQNPVYYPFHGAIENNGCHIVDNTLKLNGDYYEIDFADFEKKAKDPKLTLFILCSPHNPVSRVWTKEELEKIGDICCKNNVIVLADEIHNDLVFSRYKHTMFASIKEEFAANSITCTAPSKTFNLAGMQASNIIIKNPVLREKFERILEKNAIGGQNPFSIAALEAAYNECEDWLDQLLDYLEENIRFIHYYLAEHLPKAKLIEPQGTYLGWLDLREYEPNGKKLESVVYKKGKVALDGGTWFGRGGDGFIRLNFACPKILLAQGLERISKAINEEYSK
ncbi:Cystathionine beta-lyase PatB [Tepidanaerobacter acetatoxydans Re1]|uniref:cysteine-S-conjugate beta-lyase n=1 Tax=Tepidanaerobacter acetatoxydans (strain DSM 21804 / JCM 16047 / Re1) TaxID=1209989 RepID=F4LT81_TEPAE|nr:MalY/PatB family protein [Tepidanaerobacter acetatoxydans]AEE92481.1 Cystathionine beta-lyase [Tepidanaerobacter acetatoxydans Re1]CCP27411.1 Cystathionine beta-lyase PatB [Tepidanaerobacter acetatoxydans Re1]